jgi:riboflavin transporter 2
LYCRFFTKLHYRLVKALPMLKEHSSPSVSAGTAALTNPQPGCCDRLKMVSLPVYIAVLLFAMSTWISIVGVWVEMPLLVRHLPESWNLPSYLVIIIQFANLGPAVYTIYDRVKANDRNRRVQHSSCVDVEVVVSLAVIALAAFSVLLMSFSWPIETEVGGEKHSVALLILVCFAALASCTSSVVFLPYMARLPSVYISAYYFGQGLSGLVPGVAGLVQGTGKEPICVNVTEDYMDTNVTSSDNGSHMIAQYHPPLFSTSAFFGFICVMLCVSAASFCSLNYVTFCRQQHADAAKTSEPARAGVASANKKSENVENSEPNAAENSVAKDAKEDIRLLSAPGGHTGNADKDKIIIEPLVRRRVVVERYRLRTMLIIVGIVSALWNGVLPATQSYTCLPYGNLTYTLSICLSWIVSPLATLPSMIAPTSSLLLVGGMTSCAVVLSAFHLALAGMSPHPVLQDSTAGQIIVVSVVLKIGVFALLCESI